MKKYILDEGGKPQLEEDFRKWGESMNKDRRVALDKFGKNGEVSTIFLGMDHSFGGGGDPVLWETMVFGGEFDQYQERYTSVEAAKKGHQSMCKRINKLTKEK